jgi:hypothetical protein
MSSEGGAMKITKKIFEDIAKRRQVTGSVATGATAVALYTGRFVARSIIVSNPDTATHWFQLLDGGVPLIGKVNVSANAMVSITAVDLPFYTSVNFNSDSTLVVFTSGGFVP